MNPAPSLPIVAPIFLTLFSVAAHGALLSCDDASKQVVLARIVTTQARINFVAGSDKRKPACPSPESACKLKAFLVPGDQVLMNRGEGAYVCATFKAQNGVVTRGFLLREAEWCRRSKHPLKNGMASGSATPRPRLSLSPVEMK